MNDKIDQKPNAVFAGLRQLNLGKRRWFLVPTGIAALIIIITFSLIPGIERRPDEESALAVHLLNVQPSNNTPTLQGFGEVHSKHAWQALAQVGGQVSWRHPDLHNGAYFAAETLLLTIDPLDYEVASTRATAQRRSAQAHLTETRQRSEELDKAIEIERRALNLAQQRYDRNTELAEKGHIAKLQLQGEERELLRQQQTVQTLETEITLQPDRLQVAQAGVSEAQASQDKATADLQRTEYRIPFNGRIADLDTDTGQFVPGGKRMFTAQDTQTLEVLMEAPYSHLLSRFPSALTNPVENSLPVPLAAELRYATGQEVQIWTGFVNRIDPGLNASNRAATLYIDIDFAGAPDSMLPPLNQFLDITIFGTQEQQVISIPRTALHNGQVWLADDNNRLQQQPVTVAYAEGDIAVVSAGLQAGDKLVLTDILFPANGMLLAPAEEPRL